MTFMDDYGSINAGSLNYFYIVDGKLKCFYSSGIVGGAIIGLKTASVPLFSASGNKLVWRGTFSMYANDVHSLEYQTIYFYLGSIDRFTYFKISRYPTFFRVEGLSHTFNLSAGVDTVSIVFYLTKSGGFWVGQMIVNETSDTGVHGTGYADSYTLGTGTYIYGINGNYATYTAYDHGFGMESYTLEQ